MYSDIKEVSVIGAGGWGTTLANLAAQKTGKVKLWVRERVVFDQVIQFRENKEFLPGIKLSEKIVPVMSYEEALHKTDLVILAVPSHGYRAVLEGLKQFLNDGICLVSATKGIENDTLMIMSQVKDDVLGEGFKGRFACIGGPSFAREVSLRHPTAVTLACCDQKLGEAIQHLFYAEFFRVYLTEDVIGVELGGALKNVIAIGAGVVDGLCFGHNARAALITRGLAEMTRLGVAMGALPFTFAGLAGIGDLVLTCTGDLSRNRSVGLQIGRGERIEAITAKTSMIAEGVRTTLAAYRLGLKLSVDLPITNEVYRILYEGKDPRLAVRDLMTRGLKVERGHYREEC